MGMIINSYLIDSGEVIPTFSANTSNINGNGQYFNLGNPASLQITGNITISCWVKLDVKDGTNVICAKYQGGSNQRSFILLYEGGWKFQVSSDGTSGGITAAVSSDTGVINTWYHVKAVYDGSNIYIEVDGSQVATTAYTGVIFDSSVNIHVGDYSGTDAELGFGWDGSIAEFSIFDDANTTDMYNDGEALCYSGTDKTNMISFYDFANWTDHESQEILDQHMSNNAINNGTILFDKTGLTVACTALETFFATYDTTNAGSASDTIILPFTTNQNLTIQWGDGSIEAITTSAAATHTYTTGGIKNIRIKETAGGVVKYLKFNNGGDKAKLLDISSWDALDLTEFATFYGCTNLTLSATNLPIITTTSFRNQFRSCAMTSFPSGMDTALVTTFQRVLQSVAELTTEPDWDTGLGTDFTFALSVTAITESSWDLTSMEDGTSMYNGVTLTTTSWSNQLIATEANNSDTDAVWDGGNSLHNAAGLVALNLLEARSPGWTITDGGAA